MFKIVTVCGAGVGSSMMLRLYAQQIIKKHQIKAQVEASDIGSINPNDYDVIVTTSDFADRLTTTTAIIRMDNLLDKTYLETKLLNIINNGGINQ